MEQRGVTVCVSATTANLGPGFDCLGLALDLWNETSFFPGGEGGLRAEITGLGAGQLPTGETNLILQQALRVYAVCGRDVPSDLLVRCHNRIPPGAGLGSSAAAVLTGLLGGNALLGNRLSPAEILQLAVETEGHPDNAAAALFGGLVLSVMTDTGVIQRKIPVAPLCAVVITPDFHLLTRQARAALPKQVPLADAVFNLGRTALTIEALRSGDLRLLSQAMQDRLHQPYRLRLIPGGEQAFQAALEAGAAAVAISGAGPSLIAFGMAPLQPVADAMIAAFASAGLAAQPAFLAVTEQAAQVAVI
jgi:homoserine kinase